jgi:tetratricopeptide (TPR) repeat protein
MVAAANHYRTMQAMDRCLADAERFRVVHDGERQRQNIQQALRLAPRQEQPHEAMGTYDLTERKYDQAVQEFKQAVRLTEGDDDQPRLELGLAYQLKGEPHQAQQIFESVLAKSPASSQGKRLLAVTELQLADLDANQKLYGDAIKAYQQALSLQPGFAAAHNNLAWLYATCDDPKFRDAKAALDHAQRAVALTEWKEAEFIDTLAEAHFLNGDYRQAVEVQKRALALAPGNQDLRQHMARYLQAAGK